MTLTGKEINLIEALNERVYALEQKVETLNIYNDRMLRDFNNILQGFERTLALVRDARRPVDS